MALFNWLNHRAAGVLLHPTALPSRQGIGTFGKNALKFIDILAEMRMRYWQVCPLGPTGFGNSPYQCYSSFAGNPALIDAELLVEDGLLAGTDLQDLPAFPQDFVAFESAAGTQEMLLEKAFVNFKSKFETRNSSPETKISVPEIAAKFAKFKRDNEYWLHGYALYMALKKHFDGKSWFEWPAEFQDFKTAQEQAFPQGVEREIEKTEFVQFLFFSQWQNLRIYARSRGIEIIGDAPIFTALDSADVWQTPEIFQLDKNKKPTAVAGVPPDYFSATGQLWGNPLYDWKALKKTKFAWWIERLRACFALYDVVRIDHFRAFYDYWKIPADATDARTGTWTLGPGIEFFETVRKTLGNAKLIAEDLGDLNDGVRNLLDETGLPGMAVLLFAFGGDPKNLYLPHNLHANKIVYPGTHDNNTVVGWYQSAPEYEKDFFRRYLWTDGKSPHNAIINAAFKSHANLAIVAAQDILGLGGNARFNEPGTVGGNWKWRLTPAQFDELSRLAGTFIRPLVEISARC